MGGYKVGCGYLESFLAIKRNKGLTLSLRGINFESGVLNKIHHDYILHDSIFMKFQRKNNMR